MDRLAHDRLFAFVDFVYLIKSRRVWEIFQLWHFAYLR